MKQLRNELNKIIWDMPRNVIEMYLIEEGWWNQIHCNGMEWVIAFAILSLISSFNSNGLIKENALIPSISGMSDKRMKKEKLIVN